MRRDAQECQRAEESKGLINKKSVVVVVRDVPAKAQLGQANREELGRGSLCKGQRLWRGEGEAVFSRMQRCTVRGL